MKASQPQQVTTPRYASLQITSSPRGRPVPLVYGTNKITSDLIWTGDFKTVKYTNNSGTAAGGKGGGGGGGGGKGASNNGTTEYYYFVAAMGALCEGPIGAFIAARNGSTWVFFNASGSPALWPVVQQQDGSIAIGEVGYEGYPLLSFLNSGGLSYNTYMPYLLQGNDADLYQRYEAQGMIGVNGNVNPSQNDGFYYNGTHFTQQPDNSWSSQAFQFAYGTQEQPPPPYLTQNHPDQALSYSRTAYWFCPSYQLGQSASPPSLEFWISGMLCYDLSGASTGGAVIGDANPMDVIVDLVMDGVHGLGLPNYFDTFTYTQYRNYCTASGLFVSLVLTGQTSVGQVIQQLMDQTVSSCWWSEGKLKFCPWFDQTISAYGVTFTPVLTPIYSVGDDHLLDAADGGLEVTRSSQGDTYNQWALNFPNRYLNYSTDTVTIDDLGDQTLHGVRPGPPATAMYIADPTVAFASAKLQMQKQLYARNTYSFKLPWCFCLLEPMDVIQITDKGAGVVNRPVRIQSISQQPDGSLQVIAMDLPDEIFNLAVSNQQASVPSGIGVSIPPGSILSPLIFSGPARLTEGVLEAWIAVAGQLASWGGCRVWISLDNANYASAGAFWGASRYGYLLSPLATYSGANPDNVDALQLQLYNRDPLFTTVNSLQASSGATLCAVIGAYTEILGYTTAAHPLTSTYTLTGLYRGMAGTLPTPHSTGDNFVRLDGNLIKIPLDQHLLGTTVYFKFTSFNQAGSMEEDLSKVTAYPWTIVPGISSPYGPTDLVVGTDGFRLVFNWQPDPGLDVRGYEVRWGPVGSIWETSKTLITAVTTHVTTTLFPPGAWAFYVASYDSHHNYSLYKASSNFTVPFLSYVAGKNFGAILQPEAGSAQACDWGGSTATFSGVTVHPTSYRLVPIDTAKPGDHDDLSFIDNFVTAPAATTGQWTSPVIDALPGQTIVRTSGVAEPYLWSMGNVGPSGTNQPYSSQPDWSGWTLSGALVHPTAHVVVPDSTVTAAGDNSEGGWEVFNHFVYSPVATPTATDIIAFSGPNPFNVNLSASWAAGAGESAPTTPVTFTMAYSNDASSWTSFTGGFAIAQYLKIQVTIPVSPCVEYCPNVSGVFQFGPSVAWTPIDSLMRDSADAITWSDWKVIPSTFTTQRYLQFTASWPITGTVWPESLAAFWYHLDAEEHIQRGTATVPASGLTINYRDGYRVESVPTVTPQNTSAVVAVVTSSTLTGFTVQCFAASGGAPVSSFIFWYSMGV